jgi:triosephosphate isomerase (TIM)
MSKPKIRAPFFETGVKNYIFGDAVLDLARAADKAAVKYDVDVLFISPYTEIRRISEACPHLIVLAPYMDTLRPGRGLADVLPEALKAAGAQGVVINHCERPMTLTAIKNTIDRANELDMLSFVCADTIAEAKALAELHPDIINPEPSELIGSGNVSDMKFIMDVIREIKAIDPAIMVEQAAGISTAQQIYDFIMAGSEAAGAASGIIKAPNPKALLDEMVSYVKKAREELIRLGRLTASGSIQGGK